MTIDYPVESLDRIEHNDARNEARIRAKHQCERCGYKGRLALHHKTYERWPGQEIADDYELLCSHCHITEHARLIALGTPLERPKLA